MFCQERGYSIQPECCICERMFWFNEQFCILLGSPDSKIVSILKSYRIPKCREFIRPCWLPKTLPGAPQRPDWQMALVSRQAHTDCLLVFLRASGQDKRKSLDKLWMLLSWRADMPFHPQPTERAHEGWTRVAQLLRPPWTSEVLPTEIADVVRRHSTENDFWRYSDAANLALEVETLSSESQVVEMPLSRIQYWERGFAPIFLSNLDEAHASGVVLRLVFDSRGLFQIDRVSDAVSVLGSRKSPYRLHMQIKCLELKQKEILVHFTGQLARLKNYVKLQLTDSGVAAEAAKERVADAPVSLIRTIDLESIFGITFFARSFYVVAIHEHTKSYPTAVDTFRRIPAGLRLGLVWNYVSLADHVLELGHAGQRNCSSVSIWMRMRRGPDVLFGFPSCAGIDSGRIEVQPIVGPHRLQFRDGGSGISIDLLPIETKYESPQREAKYESSQRAAIILSKPQWQSPLREIYGRGWYSSVSLENVQAMHAFQNKWGNFTGMLVEYDDGARRSLGECRLGVDSASTTLRPRRLCFARMRTGTASRSHRICSRFFVEIGDTWAHHHEEGEFFTCCRVGAEAGWLQCWTEHLHMELAVQGQEPIVQQHWDKFLPEHRYGMHPDTGGRVLRSLYDPWANCFCQI